MNKIKTILLVVTLTFGLILAATNFAVSAVGTDNNNRQF
jgi:hypothetical protein